MNASWTLREIRNLLKKGYSLEYSVFAFSDDTAIFKGNKSDFLAITNWLTEDTMVRACVYKEGKLIVIG